MAQETDTTLTSEVILLGAMLIWLGWWQTTDRQAVQKWQTELVEYIRRPTNKPLVELIMSQTDLAALTNVLHTHRAELEKLCHA